MGADLIGFMVRGPERLDDSTRDAVIDQTVGYVDDLFLSVDWDTADMDDPDVATAIEIGETLRLTCIEAGEPTEIAFDREAARAAITTTCDELLSMWNGGYARDMARRWINHADGSGEWILFCGQLSWGDPPDGRGYQTLHAALVTGLAERLGVH